MVKCHPELQAMGGRVVNILGHYGKFRKDFSDTPRIPDLVMALKEVERCWIAYDFMGLEWSKFHIAYEEDPSDIEPFYYPRWHPILCGHMKPRFSLVLNELSLKESNQWGA